MSAENTSYTYVSCLKEIGVGDEVFMPLEVTTIGEKSFIIVGCAGCEQVFGRFLATEFSDKESRMPVYKVKGVLGFEGSCPLETGDTSQQC